MSLDRQHGKIVFVCDTCTDTLETDESIFSEALLVLRNENWNAYPATENISGDWKHKCSNCRFCPVKRRSVSRR